VRRRIPAASQRKEHAVPFISQVLDGGRGVLATAQGDVDDRVYLAGIREHLELAGGLPGCRFSLADFAGAARVEVSTAAIRQVAEMVSAAGRQRPDFLLAKVGDRDLVYGLVRMFQSYAADLPWEMQLFRQRSEAEGWLRERARARFGFEGLEFR
jgi:hypothetical protein